MKAYEPKEGCGWEEGDSSFDGVRRWRAKLGRGLYLCVTTGREHAIFIMSRWQGERGAARASVPEPADLQRIEKEFGVRAWSLAAGGVVGSPPPAVGQVLIARAVDERETN